MERTKDVRLPDYLATPLPSHAHHAEIVDFLIAGHDTPDWLRADLRGQGRYRPARGAIRAVLALRENFNGIHRPVSLADFRDGLAELATHLPGPDQSSVDLEAKIRIYWRYLQGVETQIWRATLAVAHLALRHFPVVRDLKMLIAAVAASRNWVEHRLEAVEKSFQMPVGPSNELVRKALLRLRNMSPGDRLQLFNKARMRRPELNHTDMREPGKWADLVTGDLGLSGDDRMQVI